MPSKIIVEGELYVSNMGPEGNWIAVRNKEIHRRIEDIIGELIEGGFPDYDYGQSIELGTFRIAFERLAAPREPLATTLPLPGV